MKVEIFDSIWTKYNLKFTREIPKYNYKEKALEQSINIQEIVWTCNVPSFLDDHSREEIFLLSISVGKSSG